MRGALPGRAWHADAFGRGLGEAGSPWASAFPLCSSPLGSHRSSVRSSLNSRPCEPEKSGQDWPAPLSSKSSEKDFLQNLQFAPGSSPGGDPGPVLLLGLTLTVSVVPLALSDA